LKNRSKHNNPKKFKSQTLTGQKGVNLIESIVLDMGFVWNPTNLDAGIDGIIEIRNTETEEATNFIIQVQSKATTNPFIADNGNTFEYLCDERDLDYWLKGNCPVILVCSNVVTKEAYWVSIKDYFKASAKRKNRKVIFDKNKNVLTINSKDDLYNLAIPEVSGYYLSPPPIKEIVYSNLLPLIQFPDKIYEAKTKFRKNRELWSALNKLEDKRGINKSWVLYDGKIYSFNDLTQSPWTSIISSMSSEIKNFSSTEWSNSNDFDIKHRFIQLLNNSFETFTHHKNIIHKKTEKVDLFYFRPNIDSDGFPKTSKVHYDRFGRNSFQTVCDRYARKSDPSIISYFRHTSFERQFFRYDNQWYLEITPTYLFTHDGFKLHTYYESKLKGKKGLDKAEAVFSQTLFWADVLTKGNQDLFHNSVLKFDKLYQSEIEVGINDNLWLEKEDNEKQKVLTSQLSIFKNED